MRAQCMKECVLSDLCGLCGRWMRFNFTAWWPGRYSIKSSYKIRHHITNGPFTKLILESVCPHPLEIEVWRCFYMFEKWKNMNLFIFWKKKIFIHLYICENINKKEYILQENTIWVFLLKHVWFNVLFAISEWKSFQSKRLLLFFFQCKLQKSSVIVIWLFTTSLYRKESSVFLGKSPLSSISEKLSLWSSLATQ